MNRHVTLSFKPPYAPHEFRTRHAPPRRLREPIREPIFHTNLYSHMVSFTPCFSSSCIVVIRSFLVQRVPRQRNRLLLGLCGLFNFAEFGLQLLKSCYQAGEVILIRQLSAVGSNPRRTLNEARLFKICYVALHLPPTDAQSVREKFFAGIGTTFAFPPMVKKLQ